MRLLAIAIVLLLFSEAALSQDAWAGRRLDEYLGFLNQQGLNILFTSDLVSEDMRLATEPDAADPLAGLPRILESFDLGLRQGPAGRWLVIRRTPSPAEKPELPRTAVAIPEIIVTSSLHRLENRQAAAHTWLDEEMAARIPTTGDEVLRLTARLAGTASGGISARNHVRGGEVNEVLVLLDGLRLYEPYHFKDFQAIGSIVNSRAVDGIDYYTGAFPANFGDRMSGVLSLELREPAESSEHEIGLSFFNTSLLSTGYFGGDERGDWLFSARRSNLDLVVDVVDPEIGNPDFNDFLGHIGWDFGERARISANVLIGNDKLGLQDAERGEQANASYRTEIAWLKWEAAWSDALSSRTIGAYTDVNNRRVGRLDLEGVVSGSLDEEREFSVLELRQDWEWLISRELMMSFGMNLKRLDADYRFSSSRSVGAEFDALPVSRPPPLVDISLQPSGAQYAAYAEARWQFAPKWVADVGIRWDQQNYTTAADDKQYSPRASLLYLAENGMEIRFGWGQYYQAQEINELQIADGVTEFFPAQRAEHFVVAATQRFESGLKADLSLYRKSFRTLTPRFENRFNSLTLLPELQFDRDLIAPAGAEAIGAELTLSRGSADDDRFWWLAWTWSRISDEFDDGKARRAWDQTHTFKGGASWRWNRWAMSVAGEAHTGWPTSRLLQQSNGDIVLAGGAFNEERFDDYLSIDIRVSRSFELSRGELTTFLEVTNLLDRNNPCCTEYALGPDGQLIGDESHWLPILPSLGVVWRF